MPSQEIVGTLRGFDDYVNMVMDVAPSDDSYAFNICPVWLDLALSIFRKRWTCRRDPLICHFANLPATQDVREYTFTPQGKKITHLDSILLNGNNITMMIPGGDPEENEGKMA